MAYQWQLDAQELFGERYPQMINTGLPAADVDSVRLAITEMWPDAPGGWVYEWSKLADAYAQAGAHRQSSLAYGWAKFPTLADPAKRSALTNQLEQYRLAAPDFGLDFRREVLDLPSRGSTTPVPIHLFAPHDLASEAPIVILSGGVDSWKMDVHGVCAGIATQLGVRVLAFDIPGTGESAVPMTAEGGAEVIRGLVAYARAINHGIVAHFGISMGGHYSARSGLAGEVDAAVVLGGPVEAAVTGDGPTHFGMAGIVGNALGFDAEPTQTELTSRFAGFSLRPLLDQDRNAPMLVINGADDVHVPQHDTLVFQGRRDTVVELIPDTGHCATSKLPEAMATIGIWLKTTLARLQADRPE